MHFEWISYTCLNYEYVLTSGRHAYTREDLTDLEYIKIIFTFATVQRRRKVFRSIKWLQCRCNSFLH